MTWIEQGGILVTHTPLFSGMEASTVILITQGLGSYDVVQVRSELTRAVSRLVVVSDSEGTDQDKIAERFNVVHLADDAICDYVASGEDAAGSDSGC